MGGGTINGSVRKIKNPLIVTDPGILQTDIIDKVISGLNKKTNIYSDVKGNPTGKNVTDGVNYFKQGKHDGIIAVGGGSGMDTGKGIAFMAGQERPLWDFEDISDYWTRANSKNIFPIIAVPTTAGTGSETGRAGVYTNEKTHEKKIIFLTVSFVRGPDPFFPSLLQGITKRRYIEKLHRLFQTHEYRHIFPPPALVILPNLVDSRDEFNELRFALQKESAYLGKPLYYSPAFRRAFREQKNDDNIRIIFKQAQPYTLWLTSLLTQSHRLEKRPKELFQL